MSNEQSTQTVRTRIWLEEPEGDNPFAARTAYCHGYDVYGEMVGQARWVEMLYLLFRGEIPSSAAADTLEALAVALANAGPRDAAVHAAMCGGVGGSTAAACLMAALAVGAGRLSGSREVLLAMEGWAACGTDMEAWRKRFSLPVQDGIDIWPATEHPPGFDPHGVSIAATVQQALAKLARLSPGILLPWLEKNRQTLETIAAHPLALSGIAAAALADLGFTPQQGEMLHLLMRLPGAAAHALEQAEYGHKNFPFFPLELEDDPARKEASSKENA